MSIESKDILLKNYIQNEPHRFKKAAHHLDKDGLAELLQHIKSKQILSKIFKLIDDEKFVDMLVSRDPIFIDLLVNKLDIEQLAYYIGLLNEQEKDEIKAFLPQKLHTELLDIIQYPQNTVGSMMVRRIPKFDSSMTVRDAVRILKSKDFNHIQHIFMINDQGHYLGTIPSSLLITTTQNTPLVDIMLSDVPAVAALSHKEDIETIVKDYYFPVIPVVDSNNKLIGIIRTEKILKTLQEESVSAIQTMVGVSKDEKVLSPISLVIKRRLPWLNINLLTAFLAAAVVGMFESTIAQYTALAVLLPVIAGQAGNTGAQAQAVMMRGLALREIYIQQSYKALYKELIAGLVNGTAIGLVTSLGVYLWSQSFALSLLIGGSMIIALMIAGVSGILVPVILTLCRQDPAQSSSIILTTITDCTSFGIFLILASTFIQYL